MNWKNYYLTRYNKLIIIHKTRWKSLRLEVRSSYLRYWVANAKYCFLIQSSAKGINEVTGTAFDLLAWSVEVPVLAIAHWTSSRHLRLDFMTCKVEDPFSHRCGDGKSNRERIGLFCDIDLDILHRNLTKNHKHNSHSQDQYTIHE